MKPLSTEEQKETIKALLAFVKPIAHELSKIAGKREFELVITNDENGIGMSATMGWDPTMDDKDLQVLELPVSDPGDVYYRQLAAVAKALADAGAATLVEESEFPEGKFTTAVRELLASDKRRKKKGNG